MKATKRELTAAALILCLLLCACGKAPAPEGVWADALYTEDTALGDGATAITVTVEAEDRSVVFTLSTDAEALADALLENSLVEGSEGEYGLYITVVNGISADYDADGFYWAVSKGGEYLMTGADSTPIAEGDAFELVRTAA